MSNEICLNQFIHTEIKAQRFIFFALMSVAGTQSNIRKPLAKETRTELNVFC